MKHWLRLSDHAPEVIGRLIQRAQRLKAGQARDEAAALRDRVLGMVFFNPSLRTRMSFEVAMRRFGGHAVALDVGGNVWQLEHRDGAVMDGDAAEHIREAAAVLSRYCDLLGVRTFARLKNAAEDATDAVLASFARHATVPVISLESAFEHPCQGLADRMTIEEQLGEARGRRFVLSWAPHVKGLPLAVPHSAVLAAASAGLQVTVAHPPGYELAAEVMAKAAEWCRRAGADLQVTTQQLEACRAADVVYVKSWGSPALYGDAAAQARSFREHADWTVTPRHLGPKARLMHCLPVRRNLVIADAALDDQRCVVVDQAENRLWGQAAILIELLKATGADGSTPLL